MHTWFIKILPTLFVIIATKAGTSFSKVKLIKLFLRNLRVLKYLCIESELSILYNRLFALPYKSLTTYTEILFSFLSLLFSDLLIQTNIGTFEHKMKMLKKRGGEKARYTNKKQLNFIKYIKNNNNDIINDNNNNKPSVIH